MHAHTLVCTLGNWCYQHSVTVNAVTDADPTDRRRYVQIALILEERITSGELAYDTAVPGTRAIKAEFGVSIETAQKSLRLLANRGFIKRYPGLSYYVIYVPPGDD